MLKGFAKTTRYLDRGLVWLGGFGALWAAMSWLGKQLSAFGALPWPEAIFIGLAAATILSFVLSLVLIGWRFFNPLPSDASVMSTDDDTGVMENFEVINERITFLQKNTEQVRADTEIASRNIQMLVEKVASNDKRVLGSLYALGARERLTKLEIDIKTDAADLYDRLKSGETYDRTKWQQWENIHDHWETTLKTWLDDARWYTENVVDGTLAVDDIKYRLEWLVRDDQFPNAEAVRQFKKFRIIHTQWLEILPKVEQGISLVAFSGFSDLEVRNGNAPG